MFDLDSPDGYDETLVYAQIPLTSRPAWTVADALEHLRHTDAPRRLILCFWLMSTLRRRGSFSVTWRRWFCVGPQVTVTFMHHDLRGNG